MSKISNIQFYYFKMNIIHRVKVLRWIALELYVFYFCLTFVNNCDWQTNQWNHVNSFIRLLYIFGLKSISFYISMSLYNTQVSKHVAQDETSTGQVSSIWCFVYLHYLLNLIRQMLIIQSEIWSIIVCHALIYDIYEGH